MAKVFTRIPSRRREVNETTGLTRTFETVTVHLDDGTSYDEPEIEVEIEGPLEQMARARRLLKGRIETVREEKIAEGAITPTGRVDTDEISIRNINGLVTAALIAKVNGDEFARPFRYKDNTDKILNADEMIDIGKASSDHVEKIYAYSWLLKSKVDAAQTPTEIEGIDVVMGWPV